MSLEDQPCRQWDIFCQVIDNFGDLGVCWRLAVNLAQRGQQVRLWVDDIQALSWMAPGGMPGIEIRHWTRPLSMSDVIPGDVVVEGFGCSVDPGFLGHYVQMCQKFGHWGTWINLEYLSAEAYVERSHGLPSPVLTGPGAGLKKYFFYPGFTPRTGGLLREPDLLERQIHFSRTDWLHHHAPLWTPEEQLISLFCYEPPALQAWLLQMALQDYPTRLAVTAGRASKAVKIATTALDSHQSGWNSKGRLRISFLPMLTQYEFDHLLWASDLNFVRGEDSLIRSLWSGKATVWQIYPQGDGVHEDKLEAYLSMIQAPAGMRQFHRFWNGLDANLPGPIDIKSWSDTQLQARSRLMLQPDLTTQLLEFIDSHPD